MFMLNQNVNPQIYTPNPIIEKQISTYGSINCGGTYMNPDNYFVFYIVKKKTCKEEILEIFNNEVSFDQEDEKSAEKEIKKIAIKKQGNFYNYYD